MVKISKILTAVVSAACLLAWGSPFNALGRIGLVRTSEGGLNVRSAPSASARVISSLPRNSYVSLVAKHGGWWRVEYADGSFGYSSSDYIWDIETEACYVDIEDGYLNVRMGAGTWYNVVDTMVAGETFDLLWVTGDWAKILYDGTKSGYVHTDFIASLTPSAPEVYSPVYLSVPYFNQKDTRWTNVRLGSSNATLGNSGCVVTCIAMAESFLYGYSVTPSYLARRLPFSSSGDLYWPESYRAYTGSDYLYRIYNELKSGRPVLVGARTHGGGQHWVLVTGFSGGEMKASNFVINDPGRASRSRLSEFFSAFPVFYKLMTVR